MCEPTRDTVDIDRIDFEGAVLGMIVMKTLFHQDPCGDLHTLIARLENELDGIVHSFGRSVPRLSLDVEGRINYGFLESEKPDVTSR